MLSVVHFVWLLILAEMGISQKKVEDMITDTYRLKFARWFHRMDDNKDGVFDRHDFYDKTVERARLSFKASKIEEFEDFVSEAWYIYWSDREEYDLESAILQVAKIFEKGHYLREARMWTRGMLEGADGDDDGKLSKGEYASFLRVVFNVQSGIKESFEATDKDRNRFIEKKELVEAIVDYFFDPDVQSALLGL